MGISATHENKAARRDSDETMDYDAWCDAANANAGDGARRWKEKYDTVNGEVSIDVPIIVPEVERCPVVTVENQKPWNETMIREIQKKTEKRDGGDILFV